MKQDKFTRSAFHWGGIVLVCWAMANTAMGIERYGMEWGTYWWFCNLALLGMGIGLLMQNRGLLTGFLSIACFTQSFWLIDNVVRQLTGTGPFGLVDFMYRPGYPVDEFVLSHYHYFTMPIALLALLHLPQKKNDTIKLIAIFNPFIFAVSYFVFPEYQNVNCIHRACLSSVQWSGPVYSFGFWLTVFVVHLCIGYALDKYLREMKITRALQKKSVAAFQTFAMVAVAFCAQDTVYKASLPSFTCAQPEESNGVIAGCQYTRLHQSGSFMLTYFVENETRDDKFCKVELMMGDQQSVLNSGTTVSPKSKVLLNSPLQLPQTDTLAKVIVECRDLVETASTQR